MALLSFQFSIVFTIGLFIINGLLLGAAESFVTKEGIESRLKLLHEPPPYIIATPSKNSPIFLPCSVATNIDEKFIEDNEKHESDYDEYEDEEEEAEDEVKSIFVHKPHNIDLANPAHSALSETNSNGKDMDNEDGDDNLDDDDDDEMRRRRRRATAGLSDPIIIYSWFRNGDEFLNSNKTGQSVPGFRLFNNGTLKIQSNNLTEGVYRCLAKEVRFDIGSILTRECVVNVSVLQRDTKLFPLNGVVFGVLGQPILMQCPFQSFPLPNVTWNLNKTQLMFDNFGVYLSDNRLYLLKNGSLLITSLKSSDAGRYRCNATNNFATKSTRSVIFTLEIRESIENSSPKVGIFPRLQNQIQNVKAGGTLKILCVAYDGNLVWTFTPKNSHIPIKILNITNQLQFVNVSVEKHEGTYECSSGIEKQIYNVTILTTPIFHGDSRSLETSVLAPITFTYNVTGNPPPKVKWYRNGIEIQNDYVIYHFDSTLKINSVDPEDEGVYQCEAKNEADTVMTSFYVAVRDRLKYKYNNKRAENVRCYPLDISSIYVEFMAQETYKFITYFLATENPYSWTSKVELMITNKSFKITENIEPFKNYAVFMRGFTMAAPASVYEAYKASYQARRLSKEVKCASQGLNVYSATFPNGLFVWWPALKVKMTGITIQFWHNETLNLPIFQNGVVGTTTLLEDYVTYSEIEPRLVKIDARTKVIREKTKSYEATEKRKRRKRSQDIGPNPKQSLLDGKTIAIMPDTNVAGTTITEVKVPGNVTGLLIPNTHRITVRILGSVQEDGEPIVQDLSYLQWKTIEATDKFTDSISNFQALEIDSRSVHMGWSQFIPSNCLMLCYKDVKNIGMKTECTKIDVNQSQFYLKGLQKTTYYKIFLKTCDGMEPISEVLELKTKDDVPGPVTNHTVIRKDGIKLQWSPPVNRNGVLLNYLVEWQNRDGVQNAENVSVNETQFVFPNVTVNDKLNISIRAVGSTGMGIPIYMNMFDIVEYDYGQQEPVPYDPWIEMIVGTLLGFFCICACMYFIIRRRTCKKHVRNVAQPSDLAPNATTQHVQSLNCTELHEMQTLIARQEHQIGLMPSLIPNGKHKPIEVIEYTDEPEKPNETSKQGQKNLPEIPVSSSSFNGKSNCKPLNGCIPNNPNLKILSSFHHSPPKIGLDAGFHPKKSIDNETTPALSTFGGQKEKVQPEKPEFNSCSSSSVHMICTNNNGNLRITENPQYSSDKSSSIFDSSQRKLLDLTIDSNITNTDNDDSFEDSEDLVLHQSSLLNDSTRPLHQQFTTNWNFRQPIIGPNG